RTTASHHTATLSLHDALPISLQLPDDLPQSAPGLGIQPRRRLIQKENLGIVHHRQGNGQPLPLSSGKMFHQGPLLFFQEKGIQQDRKSTRLNSSHVKISYAVF